MKEYSTYLYFKKIEGFPIDCISPSEVYLNLLREAKAEELQVKAFIFH